MEQTKLTKNKIRRLLGRIMILESKTPRRSPGDFYTSKVENFRKIWITYRNQGQGGFSTTSSILHGGLPFSEYNCTHIEGKGGRPHHRLSNDQQPEILFKVGCHFLPHLEHTRRLQKREHAGDFSGRRRDQHTGQIFFREIDTRRDIIFSGGWRIFGLRRRKARDIIFLGTKRGLKEERGTSHTILHTRQHASEG